MNRIQQIILPFFRYATETVKQHPYVSALTAVAAVGALTYHWMSNRDSAKFAQSAPSQTPAAADTVNVAGASSAPVTKLELRFAKGTQGLKSHDLILVIEQGSWVAPPSYQNHKLRFTVMQNNLNQDCVSAESAWNGQIKKLGLNIRVRLPETLPDAISTLLRVSSGTPFVTEDGQINGMFLAKIPFELG